VARGGCVLAQWPTVGRARVLGAAAVLAAGGLAFLSINGQQARYTVETPSGTRAHVIETLDTTWKQALRRLAVRIGPHSRLNLPLSASVRRPLVIRQAIPVVVSAYRYHARVWTTQYRVAGVLRALGVKLGRLDSVRPPLTAVIRPHDRIVVVRRWLVRHTVTATLAYGTTFRPDPQLFQGNREILRRGHDGVVRETVEVEMQDGRPVARRVVAAKTVRPALSTLIAYGTLDTINRGSGAVTFTRELTMVATAYWPDPSWSTGYTATGMKAQYGIVAVDPSVIPLGTKLYIPGYGFAVAEDTGSAIVGDRVDLCFNDAAQAIAWGVQTVKVFELP
jgi:3D (Asp-Asp-Asp) domain-containing protein